MNIFTRLRLRRKHLLSSVVAATPDWDTVFRAKAQEMERDGIRHVANGGGNYRAPALVLPAGQAWID